MDPDTEWDDIGMDDLRPIPIGDILPEVLASYGLGELSIGAETPILSAEAAAAPFGMAEVA